MKTPGFLIDIKNNKQILRVDNRLSFPFLKLQEYKQYIYKNLFNQKNFIEKVQ